MAAPCVTVAVPALNQGRYLEKALESIFAQGVPVGVFVADGGSTDETVEVIRRFEPRLAGWRSNADAGQSAAINEAVARGAAPYVCWLNSDDWWLPGGLAKLVAALEADAGAPMAYGRVWNHNEASGAQRRNYEVHAFSERLMAQINLIAQPATLIRRSAWEAVGGLDSGLQMAMDYDLWWRIYRQLTASPVRTQRGDRDECGSRALAIDGNRSPGGSVPCEKLQCGGAWEEWWCPVRASAASAARHSGHRYGRSEPKANLDPKRSGTGKHHLLSEGANGDSFHRLISQLRS